jgi:ABC-type uncharacterized transport system involved in gliding motility auxiliary subunit
MKHKTLEAILYSSIGVLAMLAIAIALNVIVTPVNMRLDLTADKLFTLSDGTKSILKQLDTPVEMRFYYSRSEKNLDPMVTTFAASVEDLLAEFQQVAGNKLVVKKIDPIPDSDAEDQAAKDGIQQQMTNTGDPFFLGIAISMDPDMVALPVLTPARERLLEYDLARAIARVQNTAKPVVGIMTPLPMFGEQFNPMMMQMGRRPSPPWVAVSELRRDFDVRQIPMDAREIDPEVRVLIVVQPRDITETAQFAIDQFLMRGGKMVALLDAMSLVDRPASDNPVQQMLPGGGSSLDPLLKAWGISFDKSKVVADMTFAREVMTGQSRQSQLMPTLLFMDEAGINRDDVATGEINNVLLLATGQFSGTPVEGLKQTVLLSSSKKSELVDGMTAQFNSDKIVTEFKASGTEFVLGLRLQGRFKTAFPAGPPDNNPAPEGEGAGKQQPAANHLKESTQEGVVVLVGDSDFIHDNFSVERNDLFGFMRPINGNLNLFQNIVEQLAGDSRLIGARSRASLRRPFSVVQQKEEEARDRFRAELARSQDELKAIEEQLAALIGQQEPGQKFILSPEQQQKIAEYRKKEVEAKQKLRQVRKDLRRDINALENKLKWANIAGMPILVSLIGIAIALIHRNRTRAQ